MGKISTLLLAALLVACAGTPGIDVSGVPPDLLDALPPVDVEDPGLWSAEPYRAIVMPDGDGAEVISAQAEDATTVIDALRALFRWHGVPLVIKCDNGAAFTAAETTQLLEERGVKRLLSPPGTPEYNGSCEAGIGMLKTRAHYESARHDRPGRWSSDDLEVARCLINRTVQLRRGGITPDLAWERRTETTAEDRREFDDAYREELDRETAHLPPLLPGFSLSEKTRNSLERTALARTLIRAELLSIRRRRVSPHFHRRQAARIG